MAFRIDIQALQLHNRAFGAVDAWLGGAAGEDCEAEDLVTLVGGWIIGLIVGLDGNNGVLVWVFEVGEDCCGRIRLGEVRLKVGCWEGVGEAGGKNPGSEVGYC